MKKILYFSIVSFVFLCAYASAQNFKTITADELKKLFDNKTIMTLADARTEMEYAQGHIPMAVNVPPEKLGNIEKLLPKDKGILVVFYCRGEG